MLNFIVRRLPLALISGFEQYTLRDYYRTHALVTSTDPDVFHTIGDKKVVEVFRHAAAVVPAYKTFLAKKKVGIDDVQSAEDFCRLVPATDKKNYIKKYSMEDRCVHGIFPIHGNIDESGGTSGDPTNWIRSVEENATLTHVAKFEFEYLYEITRKDMIVLSAWSCGPWATGIKFCQLMQQHALVKSCGPSVSNIEKTMKLFGSQHEYIIAGYPPFLKQFVEDTKLHLKKYDIHFLTGGEGVSVEWKQYLLKKLRKGATITSSYGASDVDIGIGFETPFCNFVRTLCLKNKELRRQLFGSIPTLPMLFQYNPMVHYITETYNREKGKHEYEITLLDTRVASPKIKYNLHDEGGVYRYKEVLALLERYEPKYFDKYMKKFADWPLLHLPFLYVAGRTDGTISLDGANVYPEQIEAAILSKKALEKKTQAFMIYKDTLKEHRQRFTVAIHLKKNVRIGKKLEKQYHDAILKVLKKLNPDFVESYRANKKLCDPTIVLHRHDSPLFVGEGEERVKVQYIKKD